MSAVAALAEIGHNSASYLQMVEADPAIIYRDDDALPSLVSEIDALIAAAAGDVGSKKGREAIASLAHSISRRKTPILDAGKKLTEDWRKKTGEVNARKSMVEQHLDTLRDKARAPLDAWEQAEKDRQDRVGAIVARIKGAANVPAHFGVAEIDAEMAAIEALVIAPEDFGDQAEATEDAKFEATTTLRVLRANLIKAEEERAELAKLRAEAEERDRAARDAEVKRQQETAEAERLAAAEKRAAEQAEARIRAEREAEDARVKAEQDAALAAERRKAQEAQEALAAEQRRQAEAKAAEERAAAAKAQADAARAADIAHRGKIMGDAKTALMTLDLDEPKAKQIVLAICAGTIPHTSIRF
ncbi:hypothetical protein OIU35_31820 [Boseaceae bacterium BT-24-1]|nr:hypothetical protein [Boseaceae bacterium BT-24-1]